MKITVMMPARNAAATVGRAVRSCLQEGVTEVLLIDDFSTDETVALAKEAGGKRLRVVRPDRHVNVAYARDFGLAQVRTPLTLCCDADDVFLPNRVGLILECFRDKKAHVVCDAQELYDGTTDTFLRAVPMPPFLRENRDKVRLYERNFLPGAGQIAFRTAFAREVGGFDASLYGADDYDLVLRAVAASGRFCFLQETGYRMYAYPGSESRALDKHRVGCARSLAKFPYAQVRAQVLAAGFPKALSAWMECSMALFRGDYREARVFLDEAFADYPQDGQPLDPDGPYPVDGRWLQAFVQGTLALLMGKNEEALPRLEAAFALRQSPDTCNNLGVACSRSGDTPRAQELFAKALAQMPHYLDAKANLKDPAEAANITTHPLRLQPNRAEYT